MKEYYAITGTYLAATETETALVLHSEECKDQYLSKTQRLNLFGNPALFQLTVNIFEIRAVVHEPLDVRDDVSHQGLHRRARTVALSLCFGGHILRDSFHSADLQKQLSVCFAERLLMQFT